jgi:hypothetical protein
VARLAEAFGMRVLWGERKGAAPRPGYVAFEALLAEADAISLHCPLNDQTRAMFGEQALRAMNWPSLAILRPSLIAGDRAESRPMERLAEHLLRFAPSTWRPVAAADIAAAMVRTALRSPPGVTTIESRDIPRAARSAAA